MGVSEMLLVGLLDRRLLQKQLGHMLLQVLVIFDLFSLGLLEGLFELLLRVLLE
jgi:hypothetical protein